MYQIKLSADYKLEGTTGAKPFVKKLHHICMAYDKQDKT